MITISTRKDTMKQYKVGQNLKVIKDFVLYDSEQQSVDIYAGDRYDVVYIEDFPETGCTYFELYNSDRNITAYLWNHEDGPRFVDEYFT